MKDYDRLIAEKEQEAARYRNLASRASKEADLLAEERLAAKRGAATKQDREAVHGTDACGYRW
jgi:hypothetical protein